MSVFRITRTRLITEVFRLEAAGEDEAVETLTDDSSNAEQLEESTHYSTIEKIEEI